MMKSIFLSESKVLDMDTNKSNHDNEYIMVDYSSDDRMDASSSEDSDYDYCDDALSEGVQACAFTFSLTEDMILEQPSHSNEQPQVPGILESSASDASALSSNSERQEAPKRKPTMGRMSNKKRRKKMKLLKKAAAAAKASAALSNDGPPPKSATVRSSKTSSTSSRYRSKRVSNSRAELVLRKPLHPTEPKSKLLPNNRSPDAG